MAHAVRHARERGTLPRHYVGAPSVFCASATGACSRTSPCRTAQALHNAGAMAAVPKMPTPASVGRAAKAGPEPSADSEALSRRLEEIEAAAAAPVDAL